MTELPSLIKCNNTKLHKLKINQIRYLKTYTCMYMYYLVRLINVHFSLKETWKLFLFESLFFLQQGYPIKMS